MHQMEYLSRDNLAAVWTTKSVPEIAAQFGVGTSTIYHWGKKWKMPQRRKYADLGPRQDDPCEKTIEQRAAEVRAQWSPAERKRRLVGVARKATRWTPPVIAIGEIEAPSYSRI